MSNYFRNFPVINYDASQNGKSQSATYILRRFKPIRDVLDKAVIYYQYNIKEGERPDIVSFKLYGTVDYDWILLMFNERFDPFFQWPLGYDEFNSYLEDKYGSVAESTQQIHHYEMITNHRQQLFDGTIIEERTLEIDFDTYEDLIESDRRTVYCYDWEFQRNEDRRQIKVLEGSYIPQILKEKERLLSLINDS